MALKITLRQGEATPGNILLTALDAPSAPTPTTIFLRTPVAVAVASTVALTLRQGNATPGNITLWPVSGPVRTGFATIILSNPVLADSSGGTINSLGIASAEAFGQPTLNWVGGAADILGVGQIASAEVIGAPAVVAVESSAGIATQEAEGQPSIQPVVSGAGIASAEAEGQPAVQPVVASSGVATGEVLGAPAAVAVVQTAGAVSQEAVGAPAALASVSGAGVASSEIEGQPDVQAVVESAGIASAEAFGAPVVNTISAQDIIDVGGIVSAEAFGAPTVTLGAVVDTGPPPVVQVVGGYDGVHQRTNVYAWKRDESRRITSGESPLDITFIEACDQQDLIDIFGALQEVKAA